MTALPRKHPERFVDAILLFALGVIALVPRWYVGLIKPIYIDELFQLIIDSRPTLQEAYRALTTTGPAQFPLDYFLGYIAARFTHNVVILRFLPLMWAMLTIAAAYFLGKKLWNRTFGWLWALLIAASVSHIIEFSSTFLRGYSLMIFLSLLSSGLFLKALEQPAWSWAYGIATQAYHLINPYAACKSMIEFLIVFLSNSRAKLRFYRQIAAAWLVMGAWLGYYSLGHAQRDVYQTSTSNVLSSSTLHSLFMAYGQYSPYTAVVFFILFFAGIAIGLKKPLLKDHALYGLAVMAGTLFVIIGSHLIVKLRLPPRHTIFLLPFFLGFVAVAVHEIIVYVSGRARSWKSASIILTVTASVIILLSSVHPLRLFKRMALEDMSTINQEIATVHSNVQPNDVLVLNNPNAAAAFLYYYDPEAFYRIDTLHLTGGVCYCQFPDKFYVTSGEFANRMFVLCTWDPSLATINPESFAALQKELLPKKGRIYFVDFPHHFTDVSKKFF